MKKGFKTLSDELSEFLTVAGYPVETEIAVFETTKRMYWRFMQRVNQ